MLIEVYGVSSNLNVAHMSSYPQALGDLPLVFPTLEIKKLALGCVKMLGEALCHGT